MIEAGRRFDGAFEFLFLNHGWTQIPEFTFAFICVHSRFEFLRSAPEVWRHRLR